MREYYHNYRANIERGIYKLSQVASSEYEKAHEKIADFINAKSSAEIIMTKNTSEGINLIANGLGWQQGDEIVTTLIEHHSNYIVWLRVKNRYKVNFEVVKPINSEGLFDLNDFDEVINENTKLVAVTHASNVLGVKMPVEEIVKLAHENDALVLIDGAQSVPHIEVDVQKIGCDFLAFSGHKMCGPTGSGCLYIKEEHLDNVEPLCIGGGTIEDVGIDYYKLGGSPRRFEAGTPAIAEVIGLGAAVDYLKKIGMDNIERHERRLSELIYEGLKEIKNIEIYGPEPKLKIGVTSFNIGELNPHDVTLALDIQANIMVRSGHHCAMPLIKVLLNRSVGTVRASTYFYNTEDEVEEFVTTLTELASEIN
jgi:cysteine desulfurase/selenocysteine lyase